MIRILLILLFLSFHLGYAQRVDFKEIEFEVADSVALTLKGASLKNLPVLVHKLTAPLPTPVEKFRAIYTWVSTNIENDYYGYLRTTKKRKKLAKDSVAFLTWNSDYVPKVFEKLISEKKTACTGYAFLIKEMASLAGIESVMVSGYGRTPNTIISENSPANHSWNAVKLNGKWYLCDATWSAGVTNFEDGIPTFKQEYCEGYFLADPEIFIKNHFPVKAQWTLVREPPSFEAFLEGPIVYKDASALNILPASPKTMHLNTIKNRPLQFMLKAPKKTNSVNMDLVLSTGNSDRVVKPMVSQLDDTYLLSYAFPKSGLFDVHIRMNETIIATYVVRVKRK